MIAIASRAGLENICLLTDPANLHLQRLNAVDESLHLLSSPRFVGMHAKFYGKPVTEPISPSCEHDARFHVPFDNNSSGFNSFMIPFAANLHVINLRIAELREKGYSLPGAFITYEPHVFGAGQFGGISKPRGLALAHEAFVPCLHINGITYDSVDLKAFRKREGLPVLEAT
ncbi:MAG: hypothetical protein AABY00_01375 [Nanoarchaeota archaeon]